MPYAGSHKDVYKIVGTGGHGNPKTSCGCFEDPYPRRSVQTIIATFAHTCPQARRARTKPPSAREVARRRYSTRLRENKPFAVTEGVHGPVKNIGRLGHWLVANSPCFFRSHPRFIRPRRRSVSNPKQFAIVCDIKGYLTIKTLICCFGCIRARHLICFCTLTPFVISEG